MPPTPENIVMYGTGKRMKVTETRVNEVMKYLTGLVNARFLVEKDNEYHPPVPMGTDDISGKDTRGQRVRYGIALHNTRLTLGTKNPKK